MDWADVRRQICEARRFTEVDQGVRVVSDAIMPSGAAVYIHFHARSDHLSAHDGGAAFDELARHAADVRSMAGVRKLLANGPFRVADDGKIWLERIAVADAGLAIAFISDASVRAAHHLLSRAHAGLKLKLDTRVKSKLRELYGNGQVDFTIQGLHRQHTFDFGVNLEGHTIVVEAVTPEQSSVASAVVKGIDAQKSEHPRSSIEPIFVIDEDDDWPSDMLNLLSLGGRRITFDRLAHQPHPLH